MSVNDYIYFKGTIEDLSNTLNDKSGTIDDMTDTIYSFKDIDLNNYEIELKQDLEFANYDYNYNHLCNEKERKKAEFRKFFIQKKINFKINIIEPYFNIEIPDIIMKALKWSSNHKKIIKQSYFDNNYYSKYLRKCYKCNLLYCHPFNYMNFYNNYNEFIIKHNEFNFDKLICDNCFPDYKIKLDKKYLIKTNIVISSLKEKFKNDKDIIDKINSHLNTNIFETTSTKLRDIIKNLKIKINGNYLRLTKEDLIKSLILYFSNEPFIISYDNKEVNIYDLSLVNLRNYCKINKLPILNLHRYNRNELIDKIKNFIT
jgi:hypothetical protein